MKRADVEIAAALRQISFASRLHGWNPDQIERQVIWRERLDVHLHQAEEGTAEIRTFAATAIHDHRYRYHLTSALMDDIDRLLNASAARHHILGHHEPFSGSDTKTAAKNQPAGVFFCENMASLQRAPDLLPDNDSTESGGDDGIALNSPDLVGQTRAHVSGNFRVL
jgi:hypothetical protein